MKKIKKTTTNNSFYKGQGFSASNPDTSVYSASKLKVFLYKITGRRWCSWIENFNKSTASANKVKDSWSEKKQQANFQYTLYQSLRIPANQNPFQNPTRCSSRNFIKK